MVLYRKTLTWLLTILLLTATAGQAATAFHMPCRGTSFCCCSPSSASQPADSAVPTDMDHETSPNCCETASSQPCDIQGKARPASVAVIAPVFVERLDIPVPPGATAAVLPATDIAFLRAVQLIDPSDRGRPPRHIELQTFLC